MDRERAIDHRIAELAARQGGVVSRKQLFALGLTSAAIDMRVRRGRLHLVHRGVYAVGHPLVSVRGRRFAALLAVHGSVLSHTTAAAVCDLRDDRGRTIHLTVAGDGGRRARAGLTVHRCRLDDDDVMELDGLAVTRPERTLLDVAPMLGRTALEQCLVRAVMLRRFDRAVLDRLLDRDPRRAGAPAVRELLAEWDPGSAPARSLLEERFLDLCRRSRVPRPAVNAYVEGFEVDFSWPGQRLVVEVDGFAFHAGRAAFERDRARDVAMTLAGWRVLRFTWRRLLDEPQGVAAAVLRALPASVAR
jgi:very-short-patch-repair endonuclease